MKEIESIILSERRKRKVERKFFVFWSIEGFRKEKDVDKNRKENPGEWKKFHDFGEKKKKVEKNWLKFQKRKFNWKNSTKNYFNFNFEWIENDNQNSWRNRDKIKKCDMIEDQKKR